MSTNVSPGHWFLGTLPNRLPYTSKNRVDPLIDGQEYMQHVNSRLTAMTSTDYLYIAAWQVSPTQKLLGQTSTDPNFLDQVKGLIAKGVNVRALLWMWNLPTDNALFVCGVNSMGQPNGRAVLDSRLYNFSLDSLPPGSSVPFAPSSHHQKAIVLSSGSEHWGYVGGIDIASDRWDTTGHDNSTNRTKMAFDAWHDAHSVVRGPAVSQIHSNFVDRWNDPSVPSILYQVPSIIQNQEVPISGGPPNITYSSGTHYVQVLRTLACKSVYPFSPMGEQTIRLAYEKAIDLAQYYIYIEEQYLWPCSIIDKLRDAAGRGVKIILVMSHEYDVPGLRPWHNQMRFDSLNRIKSIAPGNVYAYHLQQSVSPYSDIYVHSKLMIIDDCYVALGSANINNRSLTNDSELHIAIVDQSTASSPIDGTMQNVCAFAKDLRIRLWQEHLAVAASTLEDPIVALETIWPTCSGPGSPQRHHVVCHEVPIPRSDTTTTPIDVRTDLMNPELRCP